MQKDISQYYRYLIGESNIQDEKINPIFCTKWGCLGASLTLQIPFTIIADISDVGNFRCSYCFAEWEKSINIERID